MNPSQFNAQQQAAMYQRQLAQQNQMGQPQDPAMQVQMQQAFLQQQQRMAMAQRNQFQQQQGQQHLQQQFQQQRRPSPMGQMPQGQGHMGHPGQQNPMGGFGGMPPPSSGPMGVTMQPGMHPQQQQQAFQQQMMRNNNAQFNAGMNPQMASISPHPQGTPNRPSSQMQGNPGNMQGGTPSNTMSGNGMTTGHVQQTASQVAANAEQASQQQTSPMGPPGQNGSAIRDGPMTQKVDLLLEINNILLKLALSLQQQGKAFSGDQSSPTTGPGGGGENGIQSPAQANAPKKPTSDMLSVTRPLQANIGYLTGSQHAKRPMWPLFMDMPPAWPAGSSLPDESLKQLRELYARLRALWPDYNPGIDPMTGLSKSASAQMRPPQHQGRPSVDNQGSPLAAG